MSADNGWSDPDKCLIANKIKEALMKINRLDSILIITFLKTF